MQCAVCGCNSSNNKGSSLHFFRFPVDPILREIWIKFCDREDKINFKSSRICGKHFRKEDLERNLMYELGINKKYIPTLKPGTYPTVKHTEDTLTPVVCEPLKPIVSLTIEPDPRLPLKSEPSDLDPLSEECAYDDDDVTISDCVSDSLSSPIPFSTQVHCTAAESSEKESPSPVTTSDVPSVCSAPTITTVSAYVPKVCASPVPSSISSKSSSLKYKGKLTLSKKLEKIKAALYPEENPEVAPPPEIPPPLESPSNSKIQDLLRENFTLKLNQEKMEKDMKRLKTKLFQTQAELKTMNDRLKEVFTAGQVKKLKTGEKRLCWSESDIVRSVTLYSTSPTAYRLLLKQKFPLPAIRTVQYWAKRIDNSLQATQSAEDVVEDSSPLGELIEMNIDQVENDEVKVENCEYDVCRVKQEVMEPDDDRVKPDDEDYAQVVKLRGLNKRKRGRIPNVGRVQKARVQKPKTEVQKGTKSEKKSKGRRNAKRREDEQDAFVDYQELDSLDFILYDPNENLF